MPETIYKVLEDCEVKKLGERSYEFTASTSTQDRDGEVIEATGWDLKNYKKNPVVMYAHDYRTLPIGRAPKVWVSNGGQLKDVVDFPPEGTYEFADIVERLVDTGYLKTQSVGFIPKKWEDGDGEKAPRRTYIKQELLEISIVPVPSNPDALRNAVEEGVITTKEFDAITKSEFECKSLPDDAFEYDCWCINCNSKFGVINALCLEVVCPKCGGKLLPRNTKPEETDNFIHIPVNKCDITATIPISKKEGITATYCGKEKLVHTYLFDKRPPHNWTMARAKKWVEEHKGVDESEGVIEEIPEGIPRKHFVSQAEIIDELDYLIRLIDTEGMNEEVKEDAWELVREVMRLTGGDIPDDILEKVGAVLNQKNRDRLSQIKTLAQQVLDSAGQEEPEKEDDKIAESTMDMEQVINIVKETVKDVIEKAQGKVS